MGKQRSEIIRLYNRSKQSIPLQVRPPGGDFFSHEQQIHIQPGKTVEVSTEYLLMAQVDNLRARGMLRVIYDAPPAAPLDAPSKAPSGAAGVARG